MIPPRCRIIFFSASRRDVSPVISAKYTDMSSNERPFVSGRKQYKKMITMAQTPASKKKKLPQPIAFTVDKKVEAMRVAVIRLQNVATDIAFARIEVANISEGMSHAPGPIPELKKAMYRASPPIVHPELESFCPTKLMATKSNATIIPRVEECEISLHKRKHEGRGLTRERNKEEWLSSTHVKEVSADKDEEQFDNS